MSALVPTTELVNYLKADPTLLGFAPRGVWRDPAPIDPIGQERVVVTVLLEASEAIHVGLGQRHLECYYAVQAAGPAEQIASVEAGAARIDALLHYGPVVLSGFAVLASYMIEPLERPDPEPETGIRWEHRGGRYRLDVASRS